MNTQALVVALVVMVTVASGFDYRSYNNYNNYPSTYGNAWDILGSVDGRLGGRWNSGHGLSHRRYSKWPSVLETSNTLLYHIFTKYRKHNKIRTFFFLFFVYIFVTFDSFFPIKLA